MAVALPNERLVVALDVQTVAKASDLVNRLGDEVSFYKIGPHLQMARGLAEFADHLVNVQKKRLFLDFKSVDIGDTIDIAVRNAADIGVRFITIFGTRAAIRAARKARQGEFPKILVIALLTDHNEADMQAEFGTTETLEQFIERQTRMVITAGGDGVIASPLEVKQIRDIAGPDFLIVTPGVRPTWWPGNGHKRFGTPHLSISSGADYLVVGRPIINDQTPATAAHRIIKEIADASGQTY
jgi:orotidine-5'-phosphate decarboxylase